MILKGKNASIESIKANRHIKKVFMKASFKDPIIDAIKKKSIPFEFIDDSKFMNRFPFSQGIAIDTEDFKYTPLDECLKEVNDNSFVVILDGLEDPENFGNIMRTFETLGGSFIIIPKNRSVSVNETVCKVSSGAFNFVKVAQVVNINDAIKKLKDKGYWIVGADMDGEISYHEVPSNRPIALVIGSEGFGMSKLVTKNCDYIVKIPMKGKINSLNASISLAIIMSDIIIRR